MPLSAGDKLGPYEILASIGAGGMGQVYRARDARLNRDVAIKVSGEQFSERFESEAKAIAALNHPNICQIYDVGPDFLVMEYIDGRPIVDCEQPQALPPDEALQLARQIAAALETAHGKGIIHRDLKPANILATSGGVVKLLDFGLAKQNHDSLTDNETQSIGITLVGTIMGTPAYMSPEQAEGKLADARSDIFSFGAVLYEMLAGRRAFSGGSSAATLGAIVHKNPESLNAPPRARSDRAQVPLEVSGRPLPDGDRSPPGARRSLHTGHLRAQKARHRFGYCRESASHGFRRSLYLSETVEGRHRFHRSSAPGESKQRSRCRIHFRWRSGTHQQQPGAVAQT